MESSRAKRLLLPLATLSFSKPVLLSVHIIECDVHDRKFSSFRLFHKHRLLLPLHMYELWGARVATTTVPSWDVDQWQETDI